MAIKVPSVKGPTVSSIPLPDVRLSLWRGENALSNLGEGIERAAGALGHGVEAIQRERRRVASTARARADQIRMLQFQGDIQTWEQENLWDPEKGLLNLKGEAAFDVERQGLESFNKFMSDLTMRAAGDNQRHQLEVMRLQHGNKLQEKLRRHFNNQFRANDLQNKDRAIDGLIDLARADYVDARTLTDSRGQVAKTIAEFGQRNGWDETMIEAETGKQVSRLHGSVINRMIEAEDYGAASGYFATVQDELDEKTRPKLEESVRAGEVLALGRDEALNILTEYPDDEKAALKRVGVGVEGYDKKDYAIADKEIRTAAQKYLERHFRLARARAEQEQARAFSTAAERVEESGGTDDVDRNVWPLLTPAQQSTLEKRAKQVQLGQAPRTDWGTYTQLMDEAADPNTRGGFVKRDLMAFRGILADGEFKALREVQDGLLKGGTEKSSKHTQTYRLTKQAADTNLRFLNIDPGSEDRKQQAKRNQFYRALTEEVQAYEVVNGKPPDRKVVQAMADALTIQTRIPDAGFLGFDRDVYGFEGLSDVDDVPKEDRTSIEESLRSRNLPVTDEAVLQVFNRGLRK